MAENTAAITTATDTTTIPMTTTTVCRDAEGERLCHQVV
jgi:hypothetical protein